MVYGYGRGFRRGLGRIGVAGFVFRGASSSWPYSGRGKAGFRDAGDAVVAMASPYAPDTSFRSPKMTQEAELDWLRDQAEAIKAELSRIETRMHELETSE